MTDPISDMLTQIRNALMVAKPEVLLPHSNLKQRLGELLVSEGLIESTEVVDSDERKFLKLKLKYAGTRPTIVGIKRVSKPGQRVYAGADELPRTQSGYGITIISTSKGLMGDRQARKERLGGE